MHSGVQPLGGYIEAGLHIEVCERAFKSSFAVKNMFCWAELLEVCLKREMAIRGQCIDRRKACVYLDHGYMDPL